MFRFSIRDVLWLMAVVALGLGWRLELGRREKESAELKQIQKVADEREMTLDGIEHFVLGLDSKKSQRLLDYWAKRRRERREAMVGKSEPDGALIGEWEIVEMIYRGTVQDFQGKPYGWMKFGNGKWSMSGPDGTYYSEDVCVFGRPGEFDISVTHLTVGEIQTLRCRYDLTEGRLRIVWHGGYGPRPTHFDALNDRDLTLYVLKKVK